MLSYTGKLGTRRLLDQLLVFKFDVGLVIGALRYHLLPLDGPRTSSFG